tara:strand:+ start:1430 stop:1609 length:180 start_codon:yes stop_codon:yes gene_type:complete
MTLKLHQAQINRMQKRIAELVEELRLTQNELKTFKIAVSKDVKRAFERLEKKQDSNPLG